MDSLLAGIQETAFAVLGVLPLGYIFPYMGYLLMLWLIYCVIPCLTLRNRSSLTVFTYLMGLAALAWIPVMWGNALYLLIAHAFLLLFIFVSDFLYHTMRGKFGGRFLQLAFILVMVDAISTVVDSMPFIHQSLVNVLFILMCFYVRKAGTNSLVMLENVNKLPDSDENRIFYSMRFRQAMNNTLLIPFPFHHQDR